MAGKFVSIEEAARLLGVSVEEVNRLVDRKKLFPMRDGASLKFKVEEIERVASSLDDDSSQPGTMTLDLDLPSMSTPPAARDAVIDIGDLGDLGSGGAIDAGSQTIIRGGSAAPIGSGGLSGLTIDDDENAVGDSDDLVLESNIGASSPSLVRPTIDSGSLAGSSATSGTATGGAGSGFAAPVDSGLSLEDDGIGVPGLDLDIGPTPGSAASLAGGSLAGGSLASGSLAGGSLAGEAFELGGDIGDEDSASVVIATEESGEASFFPPEDSASVQFEDSSMAADSSSASILGSEAFAAAVETTFSVAQIAGLACCALVLLFGAVVMYEVAWTIRTPQGMPVSAPLLDALGATFGWRK